MTNFAILRTQKLHHRSALRRSLSHAFRKQHTPNADPQRSKQNRFHVTEDIAKALGLFDSRLPEKRRSNAVLCIEYLVTASPQALRGMSLEEQDRYFEDALSWIFAKHGAVNVVHAGVHRDESTPHLYCYVVPIDNFGKLNCRSFLGGPKALSAMQTDFALAVGKVHGLSRGKIGSKAKHHRVKHWYAEVAAREAWAAAQAQTLRLKKEEIDAGHEELARKAADLREQQAALNQEGHKIRQLFEALCDEDRLTAAGIAAKLARQRPSGTR